MASNSREVTHTFAHQKTTQNRELHIWRARPLESIRVASPYLPRAFLGTQRLLRPPESRASYLPRAAPGIHQICEFHISHARFRAPSVSCDPFRFTSPISYARGPWNPSVLRVPYLTRAFCGAYRFLRPFRIAGLICSARGPQDPSVLRVPYLPRAVSGTQRFLRPPRIVGLLCSARGPQDPSVLRVPYLPRAFSGTQRLLRPPRIAGLICSAQPPQRSAEKQVDFIGTVQKCECDMFRAQPGRPSRKWGRFYCDPSEMQVCYVPCAAREVQQKEGSILIKPFRNASYLCSTQGPRNPSEIRVLYVAPRSSGPKILKCTQGFPDPSEMQNPKTPPMRTPPPHDDRRWTNRCGP